MMIASPPLHGLFRVKEVRNHYEKNVCRLLLPIRRLAGFLTWSSSRYSSPVANDDERNGLAGYPQTC
jgi:hypothetical protein